MAEYKRYITQTQENSSVMISDDVVAAIVEHALTEVEGATFHYDVKKNWTKGMKIVIAEDNSVSIGLNIVTKFGCSVVDVANTVQAAVSSAVESMTGVQVTQVDVNVCGIARQ